MVRGFPPISAQDATVLVLGTIPGRRSLAAGQYYAHPHNAFWFIMEHLFAAAAPGNYQVRVDLLVASRIALWDVLSSARRGLSIDAAIVSGSETVNDFRTFFASHDRIHSVFFNGGKAESLFRRFVLPDLPRIRNLSLHRLPSTSPANARINRMEKLLAWRALKDALRSES
jgi:hypoxanthine-DNA glycosylase